MQWPPECYAWLPEPGTAAEWTEGGFETIFGTYDKNLPLIQKPVEVMLGGRKGGYIRGETIIIIISIIIIIVIIRSSCCC